jgi:hypothetical protein
VTGGYSLWTKVRRKGKGPPWPGGPVPPRRDWNHEALVSSWTGRGPRPPASFGGSAVRSPGLWASRPMLPARTARTPRPQQSLHPAPLHGRVTLPLPSPPLLQVPPLFRLAACGSLLSSPPNSFPAFSRPFQALIVCYNEFIVFPDTDTHPDTFFEYARRKSPLPE